MGHRPLKKVAKGQKVWFLGKKVFILDCLVIEYLFYLVIRTSHET